MFETLRKMILPIIIIVLVFFLGMIVLQWGADLSGQRDFAQANIAGSINGREISWAAYNNIYQNLYQGEAQRYNYDVPETRIRQLEEQAWNQVVANELILQEAEKHSVIVTDDELFQYLSFNPPAYLRNAEVFQTNGQFDYSKYQGFMLDPQYSTLWTQIEPQVRLELKMLKVQQMLIEAALVSEEEIKRNFIESEEQIKVAALRVPHSTYQGSVGEVSEEQKRAYYAEHKEDYEVGERVRVQAASISKSPSAMDTLRAQRQAREIYDSALAGSDFAELARTWSADPGSASNGGDLGWFRQGRMVKAFDSTAFAMAEGDISEPVKTQFGFHVLKKHGVRTEGDTTEVNVSHVLIDISSSPETLDESAARLNTLIEESADRDFADVAASMELELLTPEPIGQFQSLPGLGQAPEAVRWAFRAEPEDISPLMESSTDMFVVRLVELLPSGLAEYEEVAAQVEQDATNEMLAQVCGDTVNAVYAKFKAGENLADLASAHDLPLDTLGPFARTSNVGAVFSDPRVIGSAFGLKEIGQTSPPVEFTRGAAIVQLLERFEPDLTQFNEARDSIYQTLLQNKQQQLYANWFTKREGESEIVNNTGLARRSQ